MAADKFQNDPASNPTGGLPTNHLAVTAGTNCASSNCHTDALLPPEGNVNPGWHAAPASFDFRNRTLMQHCLAAHFAPGIAVSDTAVLSHLTEDKLILWAIGDGRFREAEHAHWPPRKYQYLAQSNYRLGQRRYAMRLGTETLISS